MEPWQLPVMFSGRSGRLTRTLARQWLCRAATLGVLVAGALSPAQAQTPELAAEYRRDYDAERAKTILDLQPFRREITANLPDGQPISLISLNPAANAWFLLHFGQSRAPDAQDYHFENPAPLAQKIALDPGPDPALVLTGRGGEMRCAPWEGNPSALATARAIRAPYVSLCEGRLLLRNRVSGAQSNLERATDFLRNNVWGGDLIVGFVKDTFFRDAFAESATQAAADAATPAAGISAGIAPAASRHTLVGTDLALGLTGSKGGQVALGLWYPVTGLAGVFASAMEPGALDDTVLHGPGRANRLDSVESPSLDYFVAFDLSAFDLGYTRGTDHPRLDWSPRPPTSVRDGSLPGPDGVGSAAPLVTLGMVSPTLTARTVATFTAGFKREHGAFKSGPFSLINHGSHYGFIEQGVILSKLQPGLSTVYVLDDGTTDVRTWTAEDDALLPNIRFARQNGVPLLETDPATGIGVPGALVTQWSPGNWSGSADIQLRTLRAGLCLKEENGRRFLIYGYFSTATPSAMARTFQGYGCKYAMLLDMNALEHTYFALYALIDGTLHFEHLVPGMGLVDKKDANGKRIPRFLAYPDNRDLFYLTRKGASQ